MKATADITAVITAWNPDPDALRQLVARLVGEGCTVVVVDNASENGARFGPGLGPQGARWLRLEYNTGVAAALNKGIDTAVAAGGRYVLLLDQDSLPRRGTVAQLKRRADAVTASRHVAVVGCGHFDPRTHRKRFFRPRHTVQPAPELGLLEIEHYPTSGSLLPVSTVRAVGRMRPELFIDFVDFDWCYRASAQGFHILLADDLLMDHTIGQNVTRIVGRSFVTHSPERLYYVSRNAILLLRTGQYPIRLRLDLLAKTLRKLAIYILFVENRTQRAAYALRGMRDGLVMSRISSPEELSYD